MCYIAYDEVSNVTIRRFASHAILTQSEAEMKCEDANECPNNRVHNGGKS